MVTKATSLRELRELFLEGIIASIDYRRQAVIQAERDGVFLTLLSQIDQYLDFATVSHWPAELKAPR